MLVSALLVLPSCVYDREMTILNDEINALNRRVTQLQENMNTTLTTDLEARLDQIRTNQKTVRLEIDDEKGMRKGDWAFIFFRMT